MTQDNDNDDDKVGYGKPPKHSRFKKGQSGNPKGRAPGAKGFNASLRRELETPVKVREGGRVVTISKAEATAKRVVQKAMEGDAGAVRLVSSLEGPPGAGSTIATEVDKAVSDAADHATLKSFVEDHGGSLSSPDKDEDDEAGGAS